MNKENIIRKELGNITNALKQPKINTPEKNSIKKSVSKINDAIPEARTNAKENAAEEGQRVGRGQEPPHEHFLNLMNEKLAEVYDKIDGLTATVTRLETELGKEKEKYSKEKEERGKLEIKVTQLETELRKEKEERKEEILRSEKKAELRVQHLMSNMRGFPKTKILSSVQTLEQNISSATNMVVYVKMTEEEACHALHHGISAPIFSTSDFTAGSEAVVVLMLPRECVVLLREEINRNVFSVPSRLLSIFGSSHMPPRCIIRVILVKKNVPDLEIVAIEDPYESLPPIPIVSPVTPIVTIRSVEQLHQAMKSIAASCSANETYFIFHYTMEKFLQSILQGGVKTSDDGQGGGGCYASTSGPGTHNIGSSEYEDNVLNDNYGIESAHLHQGKADGVVVLEIPAQSLSLVNERENAVMICRNTIEAVGHADDEIKYYLNPNHIRACFIIKSSNIVAGDNDIEELNLTYALEEKNKK